MVSAPDGSFDRSGDSPGDSPAGSAEGSRQSYDEGCERPDLAGGCFGSVRVFDRLDSTNRYLVDAAESGAEPGFVAIAGFQTAGRGRLGRTWEAPDRSALLLSALVASARMDADVVAVIPLAAGVAAADAVVAVSGVEIGLKWPNDLRWDGRKLGGILCESVADSGGEINAVVVGVGINLRADALSALSQEAASVAVALDQAGPVVSRDALATQFLVALSSWLDRLERGEVSELISAYSDLCETLGREVRVQTPDGDLTGPAVEIAQDGALVVEATGGDRVHVGSGEVVHVR